MMRTAWELSAGLLSFIVAIGIGYWFGGLLDARLGTSPWLTAMFLCFGFVAGVLNVYRTVSGPCGLRRRIRSETSVTSLTAQTGKTVAETDAALRRIER